MLQGTILDNLLDDVAAGERGDSARNTSGPQTSYAEVPGKLVLGELQNLAAEELDHLVLVLRAAVLQHVLHDVVTVLILYQRDNVEQKLTHDLVLGAKVATDGIVACKQRH